MNLHLLFSRSAKEDAARLAEAGRILGRIEAEMQRIGYWLSDRPSKFSPQEPYAGVTFEAWLQFVFIPSVRQAIEAKDLRCIPAYRVGVAALRQYDYHSQVPEAFPLMQLCHELEKALPPLEELKGPNQALLPTSMAVMPAASAPVTPTAAAADL